METITQYRITGIFRVDLPTGRRHTVDFDRKWDLNAAQHRLLQIQQESEAEIESKKCKSTAVGSIGVETEYNSDFDLLDLRIESRQVSPWTKVEESL